MKTYLGQVFMLYDDPEKLDEAIAARAAATPALMDFTDDDAVRHRLFAVTDAADIARVVEMLAARSVVIADGHHRYETALNYYKETRNPAARYRMMTFVNMRNEGLIILPTHRLVRGLTDFDAARLVRELKKDFDVARCRAVRSGGASAAIATLREETAAAFSKGLCSFGLYVHGAHYTIVLKDPAAMNRFQDGLSTPSRGLDVNVLHKLILEPVLGIGDTQLAGQTNLEYIKDLGHGIDDAIAQIDAGGAQALFLMNPTRIEQVKAVAAAGEKMPQKSTFFYPKLWSGLLFHRLES